MKKKLILLYFSFSFICLSMNAQSSKQEKEQRDYMYASYELSKGNIDEGIAKVQALIKTNKQKMQYYWLLDEVYQHINNDTARIAMLEQAVNIKGSDFPEETKERLGLAYFDNGNYEKATEVFKQLKPTRQILLDIENCKVAKELRSNPVPLIIRNMGDSINTPFDNIWPSITADNTIFSTTVVVGKRGPFSNPQEIQEDIYQSIKNNGEWQPTKRLPEPLNTTENEGAQSYSVDGRYMFFVACNKSDGKGSCDVYYAMKNNNEFSKAMNAGDIVNTKYWESTPSFSASGNELYFSSNRPGGVGGKDIWKCDVKILPTGNLEFSNPVNLGKPINTFKNEISPFIHSDNKTLYFSSDGLPGMGNFDIFMSQRDSLRNWSNPSNIGYPINTHKDEIGFVVSAQGDKGYLSSDQYSKGRYNKQIFEVILPENKRASATTTFMGKIVDASTNRPLQASIEIFDKENSATLFQTLSDSQNGTFTTVLPVDKEVGLLVKKPNYLLFSEYIKTTKDPKTVYTIALKKIEKGNSFVLENIFFDFDSYKLKNESSAELKRLIDFLSAYPNMKLQIIGHTDNKGTTPYNEVLSTQRAESVFNYLIEKGIDKARLEYKGFGAKYPIADNATEEGRSKNRRIEFKIE